MFTRSFARFAQRQQLSGSFRRHASTTPSQANETVQKVQQGAEKALELAKKYTGSVGEKVGSALGVYRQPIVYNSQVALALLKHVYRAERLAPPSSFAQIKSAYNTLYNRAKDVKYWKDLVATGGWKKVAIGGLEVYGIFKIGEIVGRRSLVGYDLE